MNQRHKSSILSDRTDDDVTIKSDDRTSIFSTDDDERKSEDIVLAPEHLANASDPNSVLTNPAILNHLQLLHDRARRRKHRRSTDYDVNERRKQLRTKVDIFNRRSQVGAFRVKMLEDSGELAYSGPVRFYYISPTTKHESFRLVTLSDRDSVRNLLPVLKQKFSIPETEKCTIREIINGDEILLDNDDRPLEIAVNAKSPLTFHLIAGNDRNSELLQTLKHEEFTPRQRKKLMEKFNLENEEDNSPVTSSSSTPRRQTSLSDGSNNEIVMNRLDNRPSTPITTNRKPNGSGKMKQNTPRRQSTATIKKTPSFLRLRRPSETKSVNLMETSSGKKEPQRRGRMRSLKHKNKGSAQQQREPRSASARRLFFSLRKYRPRSLSRDRATKSASQLQAASDAEPSTPATELSSDANLPGILKIFGDAVTPGANYKSVMATKQSNARELIKTALERYGLPRQQAKNYALCEVVGRLTNKEDKNNEKGLTIRAKKNKGKKSGKHLKTDVNLMGEDGGEFVEDYVRPLNDHEKPLILQSYWKPMEGHCRRFEIRRRSKVFTKVEKDHHTRDINLQARRLVMQKSRTNLSSLDIDSTNQPQTESEDSEDDVKESVESTPFTDRRPDAEAVVVQTEATESNTDASNLPDMKSSEPAKETDKLPNPYLITLQGNSGVGAKENELVYYLTKDEILMGSEATDIKLQSREILPHHCVIRRRTEILFSESDDYKPFRQWSVSVTPLSCEADVTVNGMKVTSEHALRQGEILSIGNAYMFMYRDPSSNVNLTSVMNFSKSDSSDVKVTLGNTIDPVPPKKKSVIETELSYLLEFEDQVLEEILDVVNDERCEEYVLAPATVLCKCIFHSCLNFKLKEKNDFLLKIASSLQTLVLNSTRNVSVQEIQSSPDPSQPMHRILPSLRPVVYWMSNSLEIFEFLQKDLEPLMHERLKSEREKGEVEDDLLNEAGSFSVNEEILALLEEVVMYAFQQIVYYLTKTLYGSLPTILDSNPFNEETSGFNSVSHVTNVYECAREMTLTYDVNHDIVDQLFAYLFFFTNVSLFNTLMESDSADKYFNWEMGVRLGGNLEEVDSWANECGFSDQCSNFLAKISALANLLATPRTQIMKLNWKSMREMFPQLSPSQLNHVVRGYKTNRPKPQAWNPTADEEEEAFDKTTMMESYDNHPPLMLPVTGSRIDFEHPPTNSWYKVVTALVIKAGSEKQNKNDVISQNGDVGVREQPDGREISNVDAPGNCSNNSSKKIRVKQLNVASSGGEGRLVSSSSCSSASSEPEGYVIKQHCSPHQQRKNSDVVGELNPSAAINKMVNALESKTNDLDIAKDCDDLLLLPVSETASISSHVSSNKENSRSPSIQSSTSSLSGGHGMPKEVFIVDIKKAKNGLGVGFVDGIVTSLGVPGIYVRSLVPDGPGIKHVHTKHHDVIRCWLQEGRLQLGDRILAANGVSLIQMQYHEAMRTVRQAGDNIRLLVGRCGSDVAMKITSSSC